jgi:plasmid segregation protein ParM
MTTDFNVWAVDDGNGLTKFDRNGKPEEVYSHIGDFVKKPKNEFSNTNPISNHRYIASEIDNEKYLIGKYAIEHDENAEWLGGLDRHDDPRTSLFLKSLLGYMCIGGEEVVDIVGMNVPVKQYTEDKKQQLEALVKDTHHADISFDGETFVRKTVTVQNVIVLKQGQGALFDEVLDDNGEIRNKALASGYNVVVDIGSRTINIFVAHKLGEQPQLCTQNNNGMFVAYNAVAQSLYEDKGIEIPDGRLPLVMQEKEIQGLNIAGLIEKKYKEHATKVVRAVNKQLTNSMGLVQNIIFTGGGAELLRPHLEGKFKVNTLFLDRFANVRGLRKYCVRYAKKNIKRPDRVTVSFNGRSYQE